MGLDDTGLIARRLRELRAWRGLTVREVADLAGMSKSYYSDLERSVKPIDRHSTIESLAQALRVSPSELTGNAWLSQPAGERAHAKVVEIESALDITTLGDDPGVPVREWSDIQADLDRLVDCQHVSADYVAQAEAVPDLLLELHGAYCRMPDRRDNVLLGLIHTYASICWISKRLGGHGLRLLASQLAQRCADELSVPEWRGYATWLRGQAAGVMSRPQQYQRSVLMADELSRDLDSQRVVQAVGMLHLAAAHSAVTQSDLSLAESHFAEAEDLAARMDVEAGGFAKMWFGRTNVAIWRTSMAAESGDPGHAREFAQKVHLDAIPSRSRRAEHLMDLGRIDLRSRDHARRDAGLQMLLDAEDLAPQRVHADALTHETVAAALLKARRDAGSRDLRGLAFRLGIGV